MRFLRLASSVTILLASMVTAGADEPRPAPAPPAEPLPGPDAPGEKPLDPLVPPGSAPKRPPVPDPDPWLSVAGAVLEGVSRDGSTVLVRMPRDGVPQLHRIGGDGGWPHRLTFRRDGVDFASLAPDGSRAIVGWDHDGDEDYGLYLVDARDPAAATPIRVLRGVQHGGVVWSREGDRFFFHDNAEGSKDFHLREMRLLDGSVRTILSRPGYWTVEDVAPGGTRLLVRESRGNDDSSLHLLDASTGSLTELDPAPAGHPRAADDARFLGDGRSAVFLSDRDGDWRRPYLVTLETGAVRPLAPIGAGAGIASRPLDVDEIRPTLDGRLVYLVVNVGGVGRIAAVDVATGVQSPAPDVGDALASALALDERGRLFFTLSRVDLPPSVMRWDPGAAAPVPLTFPDLAGIPADALPAAPRLVEYASADGTKVPAWLYLPRLPSGRDPKRLPFLVSYHGGPEAQERPFFHPERAYLLSLGYGILAPNVRGSTGYGKAWRDADNGPRRMDAVADGKAAVDWLVAQGLADSHRVAAMGGSYGGFMVLALLTEHPDAFAAGIEVVGIANFETFLERTAPYRRALREAEYGSLSDRALLRAISPIHKVDRITAALLVGHGERDPRVPVGEARQIERALLERHRVVEVRTFPDEGHGFAKRENRRVWYREEAEFLRDHLGG